MKITIDLPGYLVRKVKRRAAQEGRTYQDLVAELLRDGLANFTPSAPLGRPIIMRDERTGLPVIHSASTPESAEQLTPDRISEILLEQEIEWFGGCSAQRPGERDDGV